MKEPVDVVIGLNLTQEERDLVEQISSTNRRRRTDMLRIIIEDLVDGRLTIDDVPDETIERVSSGVRVTRTLKQRFDAFRNGVSADKIMSKALRKLAVQNPQGEANGN